MHIFKSNIDLEKNEILNLKLGNLIDFPSVVAGDAGYTFFHSGLSIFYGWDGANWIDLGKQLASSDVWRKSDGLTPATSYTEQVHHNGNVVLNGATRHASYSNAFGSTLIVGNLGIQGNNIQNQNVTSWLNITGNQGLRLHQANQNVGYIQIGNDSAGAMVAQSGDYNTKISRAWTAAVQAYDPDFKNIYSAGAVNYTNVTAGTRTFTSLYIEPTALTNVTHHVGINTNGTIRFRDFGTGTNTGTETYLLAVDTNGWLVETKNHGDLVEDAAVTTSYDIDWDKDTWFLTMTGATTFTESNLPATGKTKVITIYMTGNFTPTFPANWTTYQVGNYDGTVLNQLTVEYIKSGTYWLTIN